MSCQDGLIKGDSQDPPDMSVLCYNKGCGQRFSLTSNSVDSCHFHPGFPIFHDALKGCTKGPHSNEKPVEPLRPEISGNKGNMDANGSKHGPEMIVQGPKSAEKMQKERPSAQEQMLALTFKVSRSLEQELEKLKLGPTNESGQKNESEVTKIGTRCKHSGCKEVYQGPESEMGACVYHPGVPVFHEGMKFWSCCSIKTSDFNEFLEQRGCSSAKHLWVEMQGKQAVSCRYDWHQTSSLVVITIYAKTARPEQSHVLANRTGLDIQISFQGTREFKKQLEMWGVIDVNKSSVSLLPTKVEITLKKSDPVTWARLELNVSRSQTDDEPPQAYEEPQPRVDVSDDDLSWSEDEDFCE